MLVQYGVHVLGVRYLSEVARCKKWESYAAEEAKDYIVYCDTAIALLLMLPGPAGRHRGGMALASPIPGLGNPKGRLADATEDASAPSDALDPPCLGMHKGARARIWDMGIPYHGIRRNTRGS